MKLARSIVSAAKEVLLSNNPFDRLVFVVCSLAIAVCLIAMANNQQIQLNQARATITSCETCIAQITATATAWWGQCIQYERGVP